MSPPPPPSGNPEGLQGRFEEGGGTIPEEEKLGERRGSSGEGEGGRARREGAPVRPAARGPKTLPSPHGGGSGGTARGVYTLGARRGHVLPRMYLFNGVKSRLTFKLRLLLKTQFLSPVCLFYFS